MPQNRLFILPLVLVSFLVGFLPSYSYNTYQIIRAKNSLYPQQYQIKDSHNYVEIKLIPSEKIVSQGNIFFVTVSFDSKIVLDSANIKLKFDPKFLRINDVKTGDYFLSYPINTFDSSSVSIGGIAQPSNSQISENSTKETFSTLSFTAIRPTSGTEIILDEAETNIKASSANNVKLSKLQKLDLVIK